MLNNLHIEMQVALVALSYLGVVEGTTKPSVKCRQTSINKKKEKPLGLDSLASD